MSAGTERAEGEMGVQEERARPETDLQGTQRDISKVPLALKGRKKLAVDVSMNPTVV